MVNLYNIPYCENKTSLSFLKSINELQNFGRGRDKKTNPCNNFEKLMRNPCINFNKSMQTTYRNPCINFDRSI